MTKMMELLTTSINAQNESAAKIRGDIADIKDQMLDIQKSVGITDHKISSLATEQKVMKAEVQNLAGAVLKTDVKIASLEIDLQKLHVNSTGSVLRDLAPYDEVLSEESESVNFDERKNYDKSEVLKTVELITENCPEPTQIARIGKYKSDGSRPIKVRFESEETAKQILKNKNKLKSTSIKIFGDQTPYQQTRFKKLKDELNHRTLGGENNLQIKCTSNRHCSCKKLHSLNACCRNDKTTTYQIVNNYGDLAYNKKSLKFLYANVRSIVKPGKFDELCCIVKSLTPVVHIIVLVETWIKSDDEAKRLQIPGYTHYYHYRQNVVGGGVSIFATNSLKHYHIEELTQDDNQYIWIHLAKFSLDIGAVYKPGRTNGKQFLDTFLHQLNRRNRAVVLGDFNYNLLAPDNSVEDYKVTLQENGYRIMNKITPKYCTRETLTKKSLLDHISTNLKENQFSLAVIESSMSDHKQMFFEIDKYQPPLKRKIQYQSIDYGKLQMLTEEVMNNTKNIYWLDMVVKNNVDRLNPIWPPPSTALRGNIKC
ncbi:putative tick transposon [Operophtera brumata]|uniref:Putative tick transposon n=1 Tax=Operophtera brumata TaxID=104452 RepID=A0A0L7LFP3_OPEBR|nr:putative tick transposon [Operophtera brumata]